MNHLNECVFYAYSQGIVENKTFNKIDVFSTNQLKPGVEELAQVTQVVSIAVSYEFYLRNNLVEQKIIRNLIDNNNYLNEYVSFLLGAYDDDEFKEISQKFVRSYDDTSIQDLDIIYSINLLKNIVGKDLNADVILTALNISPKRIERKNMKLLNAK